MVNDKWSFLSPFLSFCVCVCFLHPASHQQRVLNNRSELSFSHFHKAGGNAEWTPACGGLCGCSSGRYRFLLSKCIPTPANCLLISQLCCLQAGAQKIPFATILVAPRPPLWDGWWVYSIPKKTHVLPMHSPTGALEIHTLNPGASRWWTPPPPPEAFTFTQDIFLFSVNVGKKTALSITVNCANWDI